MSQQDFEQQQTQPGRNDPGKEFAVMREFFDLRLGFFQLVDLSINGLEIFCKVSSSISTGIMRFTISPEKGSRPTGIGALPRLPTPIVYTFTPSVWAASAAVKGWILPALFWPSVIKITSLLFDLSSRSRLMAELRAEPMAVLFSSISPILSRSRFWSRKS